MPVALRSWHLPPPRAGRGPERKTRKGCKRAMRRIATGTSAAALQSVAALQQESLVIQGLEDSGRIAEAGGIHQSHQA